MSVNATAKRGARVIFIPPPLYYAAGLAGGMAVNSVAPLPLGGRSAAVVAGVVITVLGLVLIISGVAAVIRHRTTIVPHHHVASLVTAGAFRLSRNPMYTGLAVAYLGLGMLLGSWWPLAFWPLVIIAVRQLVIRPEEQYLAQRFGSDYTDYQSGVRRWL
jgi:protein-S-isoprenylcysteine O-methyltransferase Ste14